MHHRRHYFTGESYFTRDLGRELLFQHQNCRLGQRIEGVEDVRAGKIFELELADSTSDEAVDEMCRKLFANTVIENYRVEKL